MAQNQVVIDRLRARNLKATAIRVAVLDILARADNAIPHSKIQDSLQSFDRVTLYRTLNTLVEKGMIHKALADEHDTFYASCSTSCSSQQHQHHHIHFKCNKCEVVSCLRADKEVQLSVPGVRIESFEVKAWGICQSCQEGA